MEEQKITVPESGVEITTTPDEPDTRTTETETTKETKETTTEPAEKR